MDSAHSAPGGYRFYTTGFKILLPGGPTAGVTGKGGIWREKPSDAESAVGARIPESAGRARTCPVHAVLARFYVYRDTFGSITATQ
jgi:hypothetical protein